MLQDGGTAIFPLACGALHKTNFCVWKMSAHPLNSSSRILLLKDEANNKMGPVVGPVAGQSDIWYLIPIEVMYEHVSWGTILWNIAGWQICAPLDRINVY